MIIIGWIVVGIVGVGFLAAALAPLLLETDDVCPSCWGTGTVTVSLRLRKYVRCNGKGVV